MAEAGRHPLAAVTQIHGQVWLYVLGGKTESISGGTVKTVVGPLPVPPGEVIAHFAAANFPPGMRTRVHSHPGVEAFYVVDGEQCMESPSDKQLVPAGSTYIVKDGPHLQAAPKGRRNLVLILVPQGRPVVTPGSTWKPTGFCNR